MPLEKIGAPRVTADEWKSLMTQEHRNSSYAELKKYCSEICSLDFTEEDLQELTQDDKLKILEYATGLQLIVFTEDDGLPVVAKALRNNKNNLAVDGLSMATAVELVSMRVGNPLQELTHLIVSIGARYAKIEETQKYIHFSFAMGDEQEYINDFCVAMSQNLKGLKHFCLRHFTGGAVIKLGMAGQTALFELPLSSISMRRIIFQPDSDRIFPALPHVSKLRRLHLNTCPGAELLFHPVARICKSLTSLIYCTDDWAGYKSVFPSGDHLKKIILSNPDLKRLEITSCHGDRTVLDRTLLPFISNNMPNLQNFAFQNFQEPALVEDELIRFIRKFRNMQTLHIRMKHFPKKWVDFIGRTCRNLRKLTLYSKKKAGFEDIELSTFLKMNRSVEVVELLLGLPITVDSLIALKNAAKLKVFKAWVPFDDEHIYRSTFQNKFRLVHCREMVDDDDDGFCELMDISFRRAVHTSRIVQQP